MNAAVFQAGAVLPLMLLLTVWAARHPDKQPVHRYLVVLLATMCVWTLAMGAAFSGLPSHWRGIGFNVSQIVACFLTPLTLVTIGHFTREESIERGSAAVWLMAGSFGLLGVALATDPIHHLAYRDWNRFAPSARPDEWAGPVYWASTGWMLLTIAWALVLCLRGLARARTREERVRMGLISGAVAAPVLAHLAFVGEWLPIEYSLTPASLGVTGVLLVMAIHRFDLLEGRPVLSRDVIDHLSDGLVLAGRDGRVVDANPPALEILGWPASALLGRPIDAAIERLAESAHGEAARSSLASPWGDGESRVREIETRDGRAIEIRAVAMRARDAEGRRPDGRFLLLRDRSAERRSERMLRQRQKLESVGELAAGIAHEVNNPLAYVRANLSHLGGLVDGLEKRPEEAGPETWGEMREVLSESLSGLDRIGRIVERLLRFSRPSDGRCAVDVNALMEEALRFAALHRNQSVVVETDFEDDLPPISASPDRLIQVFLNLMLNARQALADRPGGRIRVWSRRRSGAVEIGVSDDGPGIAPELRERIFDPFFTTRAPGEGTGLGLAIVFDIVREHDGTIDVDESPEGGASFRIRLPIG